MLEAVFIDRDGTIGGGDHVIYPEEFTLFPFVAESITLLKNAGIKIFSFTNQPGISRGEATFHDFEEELKSFGFDDVYLCPHSHRDRCSCRKPQIGMLIQASKDHQLNLSNCVVIGDRWSDMVAANEAGCVKVLVKTGAGKDAIGELRYKWADITPDYIADSFQSAASWIIAH